MRKFADEKALALPAEKHNPAENSDTSGPILDETAATLESLYENTLDTLVIERIVVGVFFVGVKLSNGCGGVAYTPPEVVHRAGSRILKNNIPIISGMPALSIVRDALPGPFAGIIRLAGLNALSVPFLNDRHYNMDTSGDLSAIASLFRHRRVCIVGAIIPLLKRLQQLEASEVTIIDRKKETQAESEAGYGIFVPPENTAAALGRCETAVFTGAAVANGSIGHLIGLVPAEAAIAVVGPTAGFVPDPLFRRRVALVGSVVVTDSDKALDNLAEGGGAYRLFGECMRKINLLNVPRLRQLGLDYSF
ncbi:MAG: hypothetical protein KKC76_07245 [Proteobacteria bacterium]|nr:hypothetical protein [Pseudomonadota bacterium]MBU4295956.1 hypothetical protein [Pseudomonadota bacterium]MCG2746166.1 hypothetical protein [Desulfobulbaceae bacterium]